MWRQSTTQLMLISIIIATSQISSAFRNFEIVYTNITCDIFTPKVEKFDCLVHRSPENISVVSVTAKTTQDIYINQLSVKVDFLHNGTRIKVIDALLDGCEFLEVGGKGNVLQMVSKYLKNSNKSNTPDKCPLEKDKDYYIESFYFDTEQLPPYSPKFSFEGIVNYMEESKILVHFEINGEVVPKIKLKTNLKLKPKKRH